MPPVYLHNLRRRIVCRNNFSHRTLKATALILVHTVALLIGPTPWVKAQEPSLFEITVVPSTGQIVAGQPFTYTITITNISPAPVQNVLVTVDTPPGTSYNDSSVSAELRWLIGGFYPGQPGSISWLTQETMPPGSVATFELIVNVPPHATGNIINRNYFVTTLNSNYQTAMVSGPPVVTRLTGPTPTTPAKPALSFTPLPLSVLVTPSPAIPPSVTPELNSAADSTLPPAASPPAATPQPTPPLRWWLAGLLVTGLALGLGWTFLK